jgi:hypothetical protein
MPASYRRPKGVVVRSLPDWNSTNLMSGAQFNLGATVNHTSDAGLYNDATDGSLLVLWHLSVAVSYVVNTTITLPAALAGFTVLNPGGSAASNLYNSQPARAGAVWSGFDIFDTTALDDEWVFPLSGGAYQWPHEWPIAIIPPGMSFALEVNGPCGLAWFSFIWEVVLQV